MAQARQRAGTVTSQAEQGGIGLQQNAVGVGQAQPEGGAFEPGLEQRLCLDRLRLTLKLRLLKAAFERR